jgi:hypothetical protein
MSSFFLVISRVPQLEETVTKLQTVLGQFTFEQAAVLPPPLAKIRELEAENARQMHENHDPVCSSILPPASSLTAS